MNFARTHLLTARAAACSAYPRVGPFGAACGAIEALSHTLAAELGPHGIRVACLLSSGSPDSKGVEQVAELHAKAAGATPREWLDPQRKRTLLQRLTTLTDVANMAVLMASDRASAVTGTAVNFTRGLVVD